jgi:hypothetical protein
MFVGILVVFTNNLTFFCGFLINPSRNQDKHSNLPLQFKNII